MWTKTMTKRIHTNHFCLSRADTAACNIWQWIILLRRIENKLKVKKHRHSLILSVFRETFLWFNEVQIIINIKCLIRYIRPPVQKCNLHGLFATCNVNMIYNCIQIFWDYIRREYFLEHMLDRACSMKKKWQFSIMWSRAKAILHLMSWLNYVIQYQGEWILYPHKDILVQMHVKETVWENNCFKD